MAKEEKEQELLVKEYVLLARKLNKLPSARDVKKFIASGDKVSRIAGSFKELRELALNLHSDLEEMKVPARLHVSDVDQYRFSLEKKNVSSHNQKIVSDVSTLDYIEQFSEKVFSGKVNPPKLLKSKSAIKRVHNLVLSDLHIGSDLLKNETGAVDGDFGVLEESRRLAAVFKQASLYKSQYRKDTKLVILLLGDIIENQLHDARTGATIAEQASRAIHLLSQGIGFLAAQYNEVEVYCSTGNHGRNTARHKGRAIHQKFDSIETIIYTAIKYALNKFSNIKVEIPRSPLSSYMVFGHRMGFTHGDTVISPGNPGQALKIGSLEHQINRLNASLSDKDEFSAVIYGHSHVAHLVYLSNGTVLIGNGALPPPDHFASSLGILESKAGQWIFESVQGYPVGDMRLIKTGGNYDKDQSLDKIIVPWKDF